MSITEKANRVVELLLKKTKEGKVVWARNDDMAWIKAAFRATSAVFVTQASGCNLAAFWRGEYPVIAMIDEAPVWEFSHTRFTAELVMFASFRGMDVEGMLDQILKLPTN
jgi:hypothetical protein